MRRHICLSSADGKCLGVSCELLPRIFILLVLLGLGFQTGRVNMKKFTLLLVTDSLRHPSALRVDSWISLTANNFLCTPTGSAPILLELRRTDELSTQGKPPQ